MHWRRHSGARGIGTMAFYVASLKDRASVELLQQHLHAPDVILNATSFAVASGGSADPPGGP